MKYASTHQPGLLREQPILYLPDSTNSPAGRGLGPDWASDGVSVVSHPLPTGSFAGQFRKTRFTSAAVTANQELGVHLSDAMLWCGASLTSPYTTSIGGFHFLSRFRINAIPNNAIRLFVGVSSQLGAGVVIDPAGNWPNDTAGLWVDTGSGLVATPAYRAAGGGAPTLAGSNYGALVVGDVYEYQTICIPAASTLVTTLRNLSTETLISSGQINTARPTNTVMMAPQVGLSNAGNVIGGDVSFDIMSIYARPNLRLNASDASG